jgi:hypothetical protein
VPLSTWFYDAGTVANLFFPLSKTRSSLIHSALDLRIMSISAQFRTSLAVTSSSHSHSNKRWWFLRWNLFSINLSDLRSALLVKLITTVMTLICTSPPFLPRIFQLKIIGDLYLPRTKQYV